MQLTNLTNTSKTIDEVIEHLNGSEYPLRLSRLQRTQLIEAGIVIVYGASDDLMEFEGAIYDEAGAPDRVYIGPKGIIYSQCEEGSSCPYFRKSLKDSHWIESHNLHDEPFWSYTASFPFKTFDIFEEDGSVNCRAAIFDIKVLDYP